MSDTARRISTGWTAPLQTLVVLCSVVFVIGTAIQTFVIIDERAMIDMMRTAGTPDQQALADAPGFLLGFRIVGCVYILGRVPCQIPCALGPPAAADRSVISTKRDEQSAA